MKRADLAKNERYTSARQEPGCCTWCGHAPHPNKPCGEETGVRVGGDTKKPVLVACRTLCKAGERRG